jgi:hypothetical protein
MIVPQELIPEGPSMVILTDYNYWADNIDYLNEWCKKHNTKVEGMVLLFHNAVDLTAFTLKWS